jgi:regulator of protease activity HflC (stomatin/prohibitin superfamily)
VTTTEIVAIVLGVIVLLAGFRSFTTIDQAHVGVVTMFGKYRRVLNPGLNMILPFVEKVQSKIPVQNQTSQLRFSAITGDQAAVHFTATIIFAVNDHSPETIQKVAFKFINLVAFTTAMTSAVEASVREFVATKKQAEVLGLRTEIAHHAKDSLNEQLATWGYGLVDLAINDIAFDAEVMSSMSRVVAATNAQRAAEFEGQALLITRTKAAEAEGAFIRIAAENEATAARLRGEGLAAFRRALAQGISESAEVLEAKGISPDILTFTLWTETLHDVVKDGKGNTIFLDGNIATMDNTLRRLQGMLTPHDEGMTASAVASSVGAPSSAMNQPASGAPAPPSAK